MTQSANVQSLESLRRLHGVLARLGVAAEAALGSAAAEIRRVHDRLADRLRYWQQEANRRQEELAQARHALSHARALHRGELHGTVEQELALRKAQERLREAQEKVAAVRRWQRDLPELTKDYEQRARVLAGHLETDLRRSLALLQGKIGSLENYVSLAAAEPPPPAAEPRREEPT